MAWVTVKYGNIIVHKVDTVTCWNNVEVHNTLLIFTLVTMPWFGKFRIKQAPLNMISHVTQLGGLSSKTLSCLLSYCMMAHGDFDTALLDNEQTVYFPPFFSLLVYGSSDNDCNTGKHGW